MCNYVYTKALEYTKNIIIVISDFPNIDSIYLVRVYEPDHLRQLLSL